MSTILHLLCSSPDEIVTDLIASMSDVGGTRVICLYPDGICDDPIDWRRLIDDIMSHDNTICWW